MSGPYGRTNMKKAVLTVSFGTSHLDTMEKTIGAVEKALAEDAVPGVYKRNDLEETEIGVSDGNLQRGGSHGADGAGRN